MNASTWRSENSVYVPYSVYQDQSVFDLERERIFRGPVWSYVGLEAELPSAGDYKNTFVGTEPVVITRGEDRQLYSWVNRCAHKGAGVCRDLRGHSEDCSFTCVYHQWRYDGRGDLIGVPFRRGAKGKGGYPTDFDMAAHGLEKLRVAAYGGLIFTTWDPAAPAIEDYLGSAMCANIKRIMTKPIKILGYSRQHMRGNWKFYSENSRDGYHGALLHLFYPTFGIYRQSQESGSVLSEQGFHNTFSVLTPKEKVDYSAFGNEANREIDAGTKLQDSRVISFHPERNDRVELSIQSLFPAVVLQQIQNTLATRQIVPKAVDQTELVWTYFGYTDDDAEMDAHRLRNINLVGPGGFISMEDAEVVELCQQATRDSAGTEAYNEMGGDDDVGPADSIGVDELAVRGFWRGYRSLMQM